MNTRIPLARWAGPALVAGLLITGCGGSSSGSGQGGTQAASQSAFQQCLRQHGVNIPTARPSFAGTSSPGGQFSGGGQGGSGGSAFQACRKFAPAGFGPGGGGAGINSSALNAFTSCLKQHGVKVTGTGLGALGSLRNATGKTAQAVKTCQPLLPTGVPTPTSG
jgi:hypothetical protein